MGLPIIETGGRKCVNCRGRFEGFWLSRALVKVEG